MVKKKMELGVINVEMPSYTRPRCLDQTVGKSAMPRQVFPIQLQSTPRRDKTLFKVAIVMVSMMTIKHESPWIKSIQYSTKLKQILSQRWEVVGHVMWL